MCSFRVVSLVRIYENRIKLDASVNKHLLSFPIIHFTIVSSLSIDSSTKLSEFKYMKSYLKVLDPSIAEISTASCCSLKRITLGTLLTAELTSQHNRHRFSVYLFFYWSSFHFIMLMWCKQLAVYRNWWCCFSVLFLYTGLLACRNSKDGVTLNALRSVFSKS